MTRLSCQAPARRRWKACLTTITRTRDLNRKAPRPATKCGWAASGRPSFVRWAGLPYLRGDRRRENVMNDLAGAAHAVEDTTLPRRYAAIRDWTEQLVRSLSPEDQCVQSMPDASPAKWHRAHTTWFFEQFVLSPHAAGYEPFDREFTYLFNSYYESVGPRHPRPSRGLLTRPNAQRVTEYRRHVDAAMLRLLARLPRDAVSLVELGLQHEQQHQELLLTDMLHAFAQNPLAPPVLPDWQEPAGSAGPTRFVECAGGMGQVGHQGTGFCFDNETPAHAVYLQPYAIASRLVRNSEWLDFIADGGYRTVTLWMSDGWA